MDFGNLASSRARISRSIGTHILRLIWFRSLRRTCNVDVIFANGDAGIRAAEQATTTIPILGTTDDMVEAGLVKSLARPDSNTTGTSFLSADLDGKRQEILIESVPSVRRIAAFADSNRGAGSRLQALKEAAQARNVELSIYQLAKPEEIPAATPRRGRVRKR
jgi:putative tryptophan/tyrosine transport system substrate-binding protein